MTASGGVRWSAYEARYVSKDPVWKELRLQLGKGMLIGKVDWSQQAEAERLLAGWPRR